MAKISKGQKWEYTLQTWGRSDMHLLVPQREKNPVSLDPSAHIPFGSWFRAGWNDLQAQLYQPLALWECTPLMGLAAQLEHPQLTWELVSAGFLMEKFLSWKRNELVFFCWFQFNFHPNKSYWSWIPELLMCQVKALKPSTGHSLLLLLHKPPKQPNPHVSQAEQGSLCLFLSWHISHLQLSKTNTQWSHSELGQALASVCILTCSFLESKVTSALISPKDTEWKTWSSSILIVNIDNQVPGAVKTTLKSLLKFGNIWPVTSMTAWLSASAWITSTKPEQRGETLGRKGFFSTKHKHKFKLSWLLSQRWHQN